MTFFLKKLLSKITKKVKKIENIWKPSNSTESEAIIKAERNEHQHNSAHHPKEFLPKNKF